MGHPKVIELIDKLKDELGLHKNRPQENSLECIDYYFELIVGYYERVLKAKEEGKYLAGHTVICPIEIFYALDIVPFHIEAFALFHNFFGDVQEYLTLAAEFGFPPEICSAHRVTDAMAIARAFPKPDFFVFSSQACDNTPKSGEGMAELYDESPGYFLDRPCGYSERHIAYYTEELEGLVSFLEEQTGNKMDFDRLQEVVDLSYRLTELYAEINELRNAVPEPLPSEGLFAALAVFWLLAGTPEAVTFFERLRDELAERVSKGIGAVPQEKFRILYTFVLPFFDMGLMDWMEKEHRASIVMWPLESWRGKGEWLVDRDKPLENIARKAFFHPGTYQHYGRIDDYVEDINRCAREYKANAALFFAHIGCRHGCATQRIAKDEMAKLGIPMATIDCDLVDKSFTTTEEVREKLDSFFEILAEKIKTKVSD